jgi:tripartite-type tricarboxylate transporter receptor subunit TctC
VNNPTRRPSKSAARTGLAAATLLLALLPLAASAQSYPDKPVRLVIPYPPGGGIDIVGRPLADKLGELLGQPVVVDNKGGASGIVAMQHVAASAPDGYTIVLALNTQIAVNPALFAKLPYDPVKDFVPIALLGSAPYLLVAAPKLPVSTVREVIAMARAKPGGMSYASSGNGSGAHLSMEMIKTMAGIDVVHVPYKATPTGVRDVMVGDVQLMFVTIGTVRGQVKAGTLRPLAVSSAKRSAAIPEIPTVAESGLPGFESVVWYGIFAPAGTPASIVTRLNTEILKAIKAPDYQQRLAVEAVELTGSTPEELQAYVKTELGKWAQVVKDSGAKLD